MKIYDEMTQAEITAPNLEEGCLYDGMRVIGQTMEVMAGTVTKSRPDGLRRLVDVTEPCRYYHKYTEAELADQHPPDETDGSNLADRVEKLETGKANQTDVDELQEALDMILSGVTE